MCMANECLHFSCALLFRTTAAFRTLLEPTVAVACMLVVMPLSVTVKGRARCLTSMLDPMLRASNLASGTTQRPLVLKHFVETKTDRSVLVSQTQVKHVNKEVCPPAVPSINPSEFLCQYVNAHCNNANCVSHSGSSTTCAACPPYTCTHASPCGTLHVEREVTLL